MERLTLKDEATTKIREMIEGEPEVFFILVGAMKFSQQKGRYENGSFGDADENSLRSTGVPLATGGKDRMLAAEALNQVFPRSLIVPMSRTRNEDKPTYASVTKEELLRKGVPDEIIALEEVSVSTITEFKEAAKMWHQERWTNLAFITSNWHLPRSERLFNRLENFADDETETEILSAFAEAVRNGSVRIQFVGASDVLTAKSKHYETLFKAVDNDEGVRERKRVEAGGIAQIEAGEYGGRKLPKKIWEDRP